MKHKGTIDYTKMSTTKLTDLGFVRYGEAPAEFVYLLPKKLFKKCAQGAWLHDLDGIPRIVGHDLHGDNPQHMEEVLGLLAFGVLIMPIGTPETAASRMILKDFVKMPPQYSEKSLAE